VNLLNGELKNEILFKIVFFFNGEYLLGIPVSWKMYGVFMVNDGETLVKNGDISKMVVNHGESWRVVI